MPLPEVGVKTWMGAVILGVVGYFAATLAVVYAISQMPIQKSSVILLFEVLVGAISAWLLADEVMNMDDWLGGAIIITSGLIAIFSGHKKNEDRI